MGWRYPASARDYRRLAQARLPRFLFDYIDGGASQEQTLRANADGAPSTSSTHWANAPSGTVRPVAVAAT